MKQRAMILILAALLVFPVFAEKIAMEPLGMPTAATNGFGGHHIAYTDNVFSLLVNPAAMIRTRQRSFFTLAPSLMSPQTTFGLVDSISAASGEGGMGDMLKNLSDTKGKVRLGVEIREFPLSIAWVANGFGFGLWDRVFANVNIEGNYVSAEIFSDVMLPVGFAFKILNVDNHSVDAGITVKPFARVWAHEENVDILSAAGDTDAFIDDFVDGLNVPVIVGGSFDLGFMYRWSRGLQAGLTFSDIYSRGQAVYNVNPDYKGNDSYYFPFAMNLGLSWHFDLAFLGLTVAGDWHDVANVFHQDDYFDHRNWILDLSAGVELSFFKMIYLRAGMNEMLPAAGVGFSFGPCKIDFAYYGREFGNEPGDRPVPTAELSLSIRPGAKQRNWPWARRSLVGMFTGIEKVEETEEAAAEQ